MKRIKFWIRRYFSFSVRETNGFILLLIITVLAVAAPFLFDLLSTPASYNPIKDQIALDSLAAQLDQAASAARYVAKETPGSIDKATVKLYRFNPNTITQEELEAFGVSRYAAGNILKYRAKAGGFRYKEQLQRIYGLPEIVYQQLYPYIDLPAQAADAKSPDRADWANNRPARPENRSVYKPDRSFRLQPFDINTADTTQLKQIRGIGTKLSARIVKFRDKLGGFAHAEQLKEVYGLAPEVLDSLHKYTFIRPGSEPEKLRLNTATLEELRSHPYVGFNLARLIIAYRTQHGAFRTVDELKNIKLINEAQYQKLKPYLGL